MIIEATLVCPIHTHRILLGKKGKSLVSAYSWCLPGGRNETGETPRMCAEREFGEEVCGANPTLLRRGHIHFSLPHIQMNVTLFVITKWNGTLRAGDGFDEVRWFSFNELPMNEMLPDYKIWLPYILDGKSVNGTIQTGNQGVAWQDIKVTVPKN